MTDAFDPYLLLKTYLDLLPKRIDMPNPLDPQIGGGLTMPLPKKPMHFYEMLGITPAQVSEAALAYHEDELSAEEFDLMMKLQGASFVPSEEQLMLLDDVARRLYFEEPSPPKEERPPEKFVFEYLDAEPGMEAPPPAEPVIREKEVQSLPPSGETGAVVDDAWWTKIPKK